MDGETEISLGDIRDANLNVQPAFDGILDTPNFSVVVSTVERKTVLSSSVPGTRTRVRIWVNHLTEPDKVQIRLG
jgi:hypothetical protein